jgi:hypothetical protein
MFEVFGLFGLLSSIVVPILVIYVAITVINLMKQKNKILMEIRDALEKRNMYK